MNRQFVIKGLKKRQFNGIMKMSELELQQKHAKWLTVDNNPGFPCRVSLEDAEVGERVLALTYSHHAVESPYRASGPIFVRENAEDKTLAVNDVPNMLRHRLLSLRGYDVDNMMVEAEVTPGTELEAAIDRLFENKDVDYIHIHNANPGCFNCIVLRI